jgi:hypothetical protein
MQIWMMKAAKLALTRVEVGEGAGGDCDGPILFGLAGKQIAKV